jgi:hypothetical protein
MVDRFAYLKTALALILLFIGAKIVVADTLELGSVVIAKIAGTLSTAKITSAMFTSTKATASGVSQRTIPVHRLHLEHLRDPGPARAVLRAGCDGGPLRLSEDAKITSAMFTSTKATASGVSQRTILPVFGSGLRTSSALVQQAHWVLSVFAAFLIYVGIKMLVSKEEDEHDIKNSASAAPPAARRAK